MSRSVERAAANEDAFRNANEEIDRTRGRLGLSERRTPYICECEEEKCTDVLLLTLTDYRYVRSSGRRFVLSPGHQNESDILLTEGDGFFVIEKTGAEGDLVEQKASPT